MQRDAEATNAQLQEQNQQAGFLPNWARGKGIGDTILNAKERAGATTDTQSWNWQQLIDKLRGTGDVKMLTFYCEKLAQIERPPPAASQEVMGTVAICMVAYIEEPKLVRSRGHVKGERNWAPNGAETGWWAFERGARAAKLERGAVRGAGGQR